MHIIDYLWYKLYRGSLRSGLRRPQYLLASITLALCLHANIVVLSFTLSFFFGIPVIYSSCPRWIISITSIILALLLFLIYRSGRGNKVYVKYRKESHAHKKIGTILFTIYIILTCVTSSFGGLFLKWMEHHL